MTTLARWQSTVVDANGNILPGASVTVKIASSGATATIYSDRAGTSALANPFTADSNGYATFCAVGNEYQIIATSGGNTVTYNYVPLGLAGARDVGTSTGNLVQIDDANTLFLKATSNLSDLASAATARTNLGLGTAALVNTGTSAGNVPLVSQADARYLQIANNLSELTASAATARTNLGLGSAAVLNTGTSAGNVLTVGTGDGRYVASGTAVLLSTVTTKGDLIVATAGGIVARQGVGSDKALLFADSSQTNGVAWSSNLAWDKTNNVLSMGTAGSRLVIGQADDATNGFQLTGNAYIQGNVSIGTTPSSSFALNVRYAFTNQSYVGSQYDVRGTVTSAGTYTYKGFIAVAYTSVATGITNSGAMYGIEVDARRDNVLSGDLGTLSNVYGMFLQYGHRGTAGGSPQTTTARGIYIKGAYGGTGTITTIYDIYLDTPATGGTATTKWSIYQANTASSYLAGRLCLGSNTDDGVNQLQVTGKSTHSDEATFAKALICTQIATPANPSASNNKLYFKSDNVLYTLNSSGTETNITEIAGTFTPALVATTSGTITIDPSHKTLTYKKVGNKVYISGRIAVSAVSSPVGYVDVTGLPYTCASGEQFRGVASVQTNNITTSIASPVGIITEGGTSIRIYDQGGGNLANMANHVQATTEFTISAVYFTA